MSNQHLPKIDVETFLSRLDKVSNDFSTGGWKACCPAHDDKKPSLSIKRGDKGQPIWYCHAGCEQEAIPAALDYKMSQLQPDDDGSYLSNGHPVKPKTTKKKKKENTLHPTLEKAIGAALWSVKETHKKDDPCVKNATHTGSWIYHNANNSESFRMLRFDWMSGDTPTKEYIPIHPSDGIWLVGCVKGLRPLYGLPAIMISAPDAVVYILEGEKCSDMATAKMEMLSTTSSNGANSADKTDWEPLIGHPVVIIPDVDKAGSKYANTVSQLLLDQDSGADIRIVDLSILAPEMKEKDDLIEFIEDHRECMDSEDIVEGIAKQAAKVKPVKLSDFPTDVQSAPDESSSELGSLIVRNASDIEPKKVDWLWHHRFVAGAINILMGMPDVGKSVLTVDMAARITCGTDWPVGDIVENPMGSVAFLSLEDSPETTIIPRLKASGANLKKIFIVDGISRQNQQGEHVNDGFDIGHDVRYLEKLRIKNPDLRMVVIDPLDSYIGKANTISGTETRRALWPIKDWAEKTGITIMIVHHWNKNQSTSAIDRVSGSRSIAAMPRSVWMAGREPNTEDGPILLVPIKLNLVSYKDRQGMAYEINASQYDSETPVVTWSDKEVTLTADEMLGARQQDQLSDAIEFLQAILADGPVPAKKVMELVEDAGFSYKTLQKKDVQKRAGVVTESTKDSNNKVTGWAWRLARCPT